MLSLATSRSGEWVCAYIIAAEIQHLALTTPQHGERCIDRWHWHGGKRQATQRNITRVKAN